MEYSKELRVFSLLLLSIFIILLKLTYNANMKDENAKKKCLS